MLFVYDRLLIRFMTTESRNVLDSKKCIGSARRLDGGVSNHPASARSIQNTSAKAADICRISGGQDLPESLAQIGRELTMLCA